MLPGGGKDTNKILYEEDFPPIHFINHNYNSICLLFGSRSRLWYFVYDLDGYFLGIHIDCIYT